MGRSEEDMRTSRGDEREKKVRGHVGVGEVPSRNGKY